MSTTASFKSLINKFSFPDEETPSCWSLNKVKKILGELGIGNYNIKERERVVYVGSQTELMRILLYLVPYEVSSEYHLTLSKSDNSIRLQIGCWQFETHAQ
ncbi:MAG: hypothetical protein K6T91_04175 [Firmicutes bacterium]|nr:hypothetical protein [Bacillota bacterium]